MRYRLDGNQPGVLPASHGDYDRIASILTGELLQGHECAYSLLLTEID